MATTFELINKTILTSSTGSVEFTSIPTTYTDLYLQFSARSSGGSTNDNTYINFNGNDSSYSEIVLYGSGSSAASGASGSGSGSSKNLLPIPANGATANTFGSGGIYVPNYLSSNYKSVSLDGVAENNASSPVYMQIQALLWANTAAINALKIALNSANSFMSGSSFYLYGIKNS